MSGKIVIGVVAGLVVGVGIGVFAGGASSEQDTLKQELAQVQIERDEVADASAAATNDLESLQRRMTTLDRELSDARAALEAAEAQAEAAKAVAELADGPADAEHAALEPRGDSDLGVGQAFSYPEYDEHLASVNWTEIGEHVGAIAPLIAEIFGAIAEGRQPSPEAVGSIQQHNGPLVTVAMNLYQKLPGETVNGAFTHPSAVSNIIVSTLEALGKPLDAAQLAALERVGSEFVAEERNRVQNYGDDTLALRRHADESLLKGRFYDAAMALLTEEQHTALRPEATRGRVTADLFSASLVWVGRAQPVPFRDRADFAEIIAERTSRELGLEGEARDRFNATVTAWAQALPDDLMKREPDALWLKGLLPIDVIDLSAKHMIVLMDRILSDVDLSEEAAKELRDHNGVFVPTWRPN